MDFEGQWLWNINYMSQALLFTSCVALGKLLYLSGFGSPTCKIKHSNSSLSGGYKDYMSSYMSSFGHAINGQCQSPISCFCDNPGAQYLVALHSCGFITISYWGGLLLFLSLSLSFVFKLRMQQLEVYKVYVHKIWTPLHVSISKCWCVGLTVY